LLLLGLVAVSYHDILAAPFIFDDIGDISNNQSIRRLLPPTWLYHQSRPLVVLSFALNYAAGRLEVGGYHSVNISIHAACAVLGFLIARRMLKSDVLALLASAIWAAHPLNTTVVTYTVHRYESSAALGMLGALYCFQRALEFGRNAAHWRIASLIGAALACASKEVSVALPFLLLAYDRCFAAGTFRSALRLRYQYHLASFATLGIVALLWRLGEKYPTQGFGMPDLTPLDYARSQPGVIVHYLRLALWPDALCFDYFDWPVARSLREVALPAAILAMLGAGASFAWIRKPQVGFVAAVWLFILAPTSSFLPLKGELVAERRVYLPLFALIALLVAGANRLATSRQRFGVLVAISAVAVGALTARTIVRNRDFATQESAYRSVLALRPNNVRARYHLALVLHAQGNDDIALQEFLRAATREPRCSFCQNNAGTLLAQKHELSEAEARFLAAVRAEPSNTTYRLNLVETRLLQGKWAAALNTVRRGLDREPSNPELQSSLHRVETEVAKQCPAGLPRSADCP
jgi:protein O-mannosyl-transferase